MRLAKIFIKIVGALGVLMPWFFQSQLGNALYFLVGAGYFLILSFDFFLPRSSYWWWNLVVHLIISLGWILIAWSFHFSGPKWLTLISIILGALIIVFFGYSARMKLIGRPDPSLEIFIELRKKITHSK